MSTSNAAVASPNEFLRTQAWLGLALLAALVGLLTDRAIADETEAFFKKGTISFLELRLDETAVASLRAEPRNYARVSIVVDGTELTTAAGVKLKGAAGSFQSFDERPGFTINLAKFDGEARFHGMRKFHLNNAVQDPSFLSEWLSSSIAREADVPATLVTHARLKVNDRDLGLYVLKESFDQDFLRRNFRNANGNLYDGGFCSDIDSELERDEGKDVGENGETRADLRAIAEACNDPDMKSRWTRLEKLVDIPAFLRFLALEAMLAHWDGYAFNSNNYRLYFEPGKCARFIPHGMDQCFQDPGMSALDMPRALVAASVMKNPVWRRDYRREIERLIPQFDPKRLTRRLEPVEERLQKALRSVSSDAAVSQAAEAKGLLERLTQRAQHLRMEKDAPEPKPLILKLGTPTVVRGFHGMSEVEDAHVEEVDIDAQGIRWYRVTAGPSGRCIAGFRKGMLLDRGRYQFEALVRVLGVNSLDASDAPSKGACVRISGASQAASLVGDGERTLTFEFDVEESTADIELVLELRATSGTASFRADSVRITKLRPSKSPAAPDTDR
ncbi:MAG: CotH kinase family protein [Limnohabitans sp.]|nr:CotH kinase family protein [Limnohabitans sp.]